LLAAFLKGFEQLTDPRIRRLLWISGGLAILVFVVLWGVVAYLLTHTALSSIGLLDTVIDVLGGLATLVVTWILFPAVLSTTVGLFLDEVAGAVEQRHYPAWPPARDAPILEIIGSSLRFLGILIVLNIILLPFLLLPPLFPFVFYGVNGYLLGREYYEAVALRHADSPTARALWRRHRLRFLLAGVIIAILLTVPVLNIVVPIVATAAMVHLWAGVKARA
jgi:CysZ protein